MALLAALMLRKGTLGRLSPPAPAQETRDEKGRAVARVISQLVRRERMGGKVPLTLLRAEGPGQPPLLSLAPLV